MSEDTHPSDSQPVPQPQPSQPPQVAPPAQVPQPVPAADPQQGTPAASAAPPVRRRRRVRVAAVVLTVLLVLGGAGATGWYLWHRDQPGTVTTTGLVTLSDAWADGAHELWREHLDPDTEIAVLGQYLLTFSRNIEGNLKLWDATGYAVSEQGATQLWSDQTLFPDESFGHVLAWGDSTAVYGTTLIDLEDGTTQDAPWGSDALVDVAGSVAISCDKDEQCTAWDQDHKRMWSLSVPDSSTDNKYGYYGVDGFTRNSYLPVVQHGKDRFVTIAGSVVNLDTGKELALEGASTGTSRIIAAQDGWVRVSDGADEDPTATSYTVEGKRIKDLPVPDTEQVQPALPPDTLRTLDQVASDLRGSVTSSGIEMWKEDTGCLKKVQTSSSAFPVPSNDLGEDEFCLSGGQPSAQGSVLALTTFTLGYNPNNIFLSLMDLSTGEITSLSGTGQDRLSFHVASSPTLVLAYENETLTAYAPGAS